MPKATGYLNKREKKSSFTRTLFELLKAKTIQYLDSGNFTSSKLLENYGKLSFAE